MADTRRLHRPDEPRDHGRAVPGVAGARIADACGIGAFVAHEALPTALVPTITQLAEGTAAALTPSR